MAASGAWKDPRISPTARTPSWFDVLSTSNRRLTKACTPSGRNRVHSRGITPESGSLCAAGLPAIAAQPSCRRCWGGFILPAKSSRGLIFVLPLPAGNRVDHPRDRARMPFGLAGGGRGVEFRHDAAHRVGGVGVGVGGVGWCWCWWRFRRRGPSLPQRGPVGRTDFAEGGFVTPRIPCAPENAGRKT